MKKTIRVAVTGAAGQIGYALLFRLAAGEAFGKDTEIHLSLLELEAALPALEGVVMELEDCAFPLLKSIKTSALPDEAFKDVDWALLVGSVPRKANMERGDLLRINGGIFVKQGKALDYHAKPNCRVLVIGNPCNTNAYIAKTVARKLPAKNFFAMTMLDQNRAVAQLAKKAQVENSAVKNLVVWGNHSLTQFPDFYHATINGKPAGEVIKDEAWLKKDFLEIVQQRGAAVIKTRGFSSAGSAANAIIETVKKITTPTGKNEMFSLGVGSDGSYGIEPGLVFGFPVKSDGQELEIVPGISHNSFAQEKLVLTQKELLAERDVVSSLF